MRKLLRENQDLAQIPFDRQQRQAGDQDFRWHECSKLPHWEKPRFG